MSHFAVYAANSDVNVSVCGASPFPAPVVTSPQDGATYASSVLMEGTATPNVTVHAYRNGVDVGNVSASGSGEFAISVSLVMGTNVLRASTNNDCGPPTYSNAVTIERQAVPDPPPSTPSSPGGSSSGDPTPSTETPSSDAAEEAPSPGTQTPGGGVTSAPSGNTGDDGIITPVIREPARDTQVDNPFLIVSGTAAPNTRVVIWRNGDRLAEVMSDDRGLFQAGITLRPGENKLMVTIGSGDKLRQSKIVTVTYTPKQPYSFVKSTAGKLFFGATIAVAISFLAHFIIEHSILGEGLHRRFGAKGRK